MMNQPLRRVDPLGRSATPTEIRPTAPRALVPLTGSAWPICGGSVRAIVDRETTANKDAARVLEEFARLPERLSQHARGSEVQAIKEAIGDAGLIFAADAPNAK